MITTSKIVAYRYSSINNHLNIYHYGDITDYASSGTEPIKI